MLNTLGQSDIHTQWAAQPFAGCRQAQQGLRRQGQQGQHSHWRLQVQVQVQVRSAGHGGGDGRQGRQVGEPPWLHPIVVPDDMMSQRGINEWLERHFVDTHRYPQPHCCSQLHGDLKALQVCSAIYKIGALGGAGARRCSPGAGPVVVRFCPP